MCLEKAYITGEDVISLQLVTFVHNGHARVGAHVEGRIVDIRAALAARFEEGGEGRPWELASALIPSDMRSFIQRGEPALAQARSAVEYALAKGEEDPGPFASRLVYRLDEVAVHAPILNPEKIIAVGLNYLDHAKESGMEPPKQPLFFSKYASSIVGPRSPVVLPPPDVTSKVDYEVELAVVIGKAAKNVPVEQAMDHVFGYTILNDISARDLQFEDGQWVKGKALDTFAPLGPWIVTKDEIADPHNLRLVLALNGEVMQDSNTSNLIFNIPALIAYFSRLFTLKPGDIISTGTPHGVGQSRVPPRFLKPGDTLVAEIEGIGALENPVVAAGDLK